MKPNDRAQAEQAGIRWADRKADALEGIPAADWPEGWDPAWAGELHLALEQRLDSARFDELVAFAQDAAAARWSELIESRRDAEDARGAAEAIEARAVELYEALRTHVPAGLAVGRDGGRVYLCDVSADVETSVASLAEAASVISDWQERHHGR